MPNSQKIVVHQDEDYGCIEKSGTIETSGCASCVGIAVLDKKNEIAMVGHWANPDHYGEYHNMINHIGNLDPDTEIAIAGGEGSDDLKMVAEHIKSVLPSAILSFYPVSGHGLSADLFVDLCNNIIECKIL